MTEKELHKEDKWIIKYGYYFVGGTIGMIIVYVLSLISLVWSCK